MRRAITKHLKDFAAIIALFVVALGVSGYILANQRLTLPGWVPAVGKSFFEFKGEFDTAQAVTPGQGQTAQVAGIEIGDISKVELHDGKALVTMRLDRDKQDVPIYRDATLLLRPKTGLKDMVIEVTPGSPQAGELKEGATIPIAQTAPDVNLDETLSALDGDTRQFLAVLANSASEGLQGQGGDLAQVLRRFQPLNRDLRAINEQLAERRHNIRRVIHNFSLLSQSLGDKDADLARLVTASNAVFDTFASQEANLRAAVRELPGALQATTTTLTKTRTLATELGPTAQALRPGARALAPSLRAARPFMRTATPIIRNPIRPFTRAALPLVRDLRPALRDLNAVTPDLQKTVSIVNYALNTLAYNPPGDKDEGYLFWLSWANHLAPTIFSTQDAHGPIRRGLIVFSCAALAVLDNVAQVNPQLATIIGLLNAPRTSDVCPSQTGAPG